MAAADKPVSTGLSRARKDGEPDGRYKLTQEKLDAVCKRIREGSFVAHACELERVPKTTLYDAMERDPEVRLSVEEAQAISEEQTLSQMRTNLFDWKREAWELERKRRDLFKPPKAEVESKNEHAGPGGSALPTIVVQVTEEQMLRGAARKLGDK